MVSCSRLAAVETPPRAHSSSPTTERRESFKGLFSPPLLQPITVVHDGGKTWGTRVAERRRQQTQTPSAQSNPAVAAAGRLGQPSPRVPARRWVVDGHGKSASPVPCPCMESVDPQEMGEPLGLCAASPSCSSHLLVSARFAFELPRVPPAGPLMFRHPWTRDGKSGGGRRRNLISSSQPRVMPSLAPATGDGWEWEVTPFHFFLSRSRIRI
ncbi:hypothetical protein QBC39DRAFT_132550 [Podospora conica]|nr:hypothetical protein QBC39DRAFT_132550 [Schizothecium conicum]